MDLLDAETQIPPKKDVLDQAAQVVNSLPEPKEETKKDETEFPTNFLRNYDLSFRRLFEELNKISKTDHASREPLLQQRALMMSLAAGNPQLEQIINHNLEQERSSHSKTSGI